jgi:hypothetical protein
MGVALFTIVVSLVSPVAMSAAMGQQSRYQIANESIRVNKDDYVLG